MAYRVEVSDEANANADEAYFWIAKRAPVAAAKWYAGLMNAIADLNHHPERHALAPETKFFGTKIRQMLYGKRQGKYRVLYEIRGKVVRVLHIRHSARDYWRP